jgi:nicotinate-nucleotide adenylyltransferase
MTEKMGFFSRMFAYLRALPFGLFSKKGKKAQQKIGIFGGSFDPPHYGHINLVLSLMEKHQLDEVYIIPSYSTPWKEMQHSPHKRLLMTQLAFAPLPKCRVLDIEMQRKGDSYTIDTVRFLMKTDKAFSQAQRYILLGSDLLESLHLWKDYEELFSLVTPIVGSRLSSTEVDKLTLNRDIKEKILSLWTDIGILDISSTNLKKRVAQHLYVNHLMPKDVMELMLKR